MSIPRSIHRVVPSQKVNMGGIILDQPLPFRGVEQIDPFLLIHHWDSRLPGGQKPFEAGVGPHPHRGFSPVTFIFKGAVHHRDSQGNSSIVRAGGTQWMNAGNGIVHSERPEIGLAKEGGAFELIQFWVNTPAALKMEAPEYFPLDAESTPVSSESDGKAQIAVVAGDYRDLKGPVPTQSPLLALRITLKAGATVALPVPKSHNTLIYQLDGNLRINGTQETKARDLIWFYNDGDVVTFEATADTRAILLAGQPISEPLATYGPFVMNNQAQVKEALLDYQSGKMGFLVEK